MKKTVSRFVVNQQRANLCPDSIEHTIQLFEMGRYADALTGCLNFVNTGDIRILLALKEIYQFGLAGELDLEKAEDYLSMAARQDAESCYQLAQWLERGFRDDPDPVTAIQYYLQAADQGHTKALLYVAECYGSGRLLSRDPAKAFECYLKITNRENRLNDEAEANAEYRLAMCFLKGIGTEANCQEALHYMSMAARHRSKEAIYELALMYITGEGVTPDARKAFQLMNEVAAMNYAPAQYKLGSMYENAIGTFENQDRAFSWYHMAYELNYLPAYAKMASFLLEGTASARDCRKAREIASRAWEMGDADAGYVLYGIYMQGQGVKTDRQKAVEYLRAAAEGGSIASRRTLGELYAAGVEGCIEQDFQQSVKWYADAADHNDTEAMMGLAQLYLSPDSRIQDVEKAHQLLVRLAEKFGDRNAYNLLGKLEEEGCFGEPDRNRIRFNFTEAARRGLEDAKFSLARLYHEGKLLEKDDHIAYYHIYGISDSYDNPDYPALLKAVEAGLSEADKKNIRQNVRMETMSIASHKIQYQG